MVPTLRIPSLWSKSVGMGYEGEATSTCKVVLERHPSADLWIARCKSCGWSSHPSRYQSEVKADAYGHEHPAHHLPLDLLATAFDVEQRNLSSRP